MNSPIWRLGFSTVSLDIATCCSVLVQSQRFQFLLQILIRRGVLHGQPWATRQNLVETTAPGKAILNRGQLGVRGIPTLHGVLLLGRMRCRGRRVPNQGGGPQTEGSSHHHHPLPLKTEGSRQQHPLPAAPSAATGTLRELLCPTLATHPPTPMGPRGTPDRQTDPPQEPWCSDPVLTARL